MRTANVYLLLAGAALTALGCEASDAPAASSDDALSGTPGSEVDEAERERAARAAAAREEFRGIVYDAYRASSRAALTEESKGTFPCVPGGARYFRWTIDAAGPNDPSGSVTRLAAALKRRLLNPEMLIVEGPTDATGRADFTIFSHRGPEYEWCGSPGLVSRTFPELTCFDVQPGKGPTRDQCRAPESSR